MFDESNVVFRTVGFHVFKMDWSGPRWEKVNNLGDRMLFIGLNSSFSLSASDFPGCGCWEFYLFYRRLLGVQL